MSLVRIKIVGLSDQQRPLLNMAKVCSMSSAVGWVAVVPITSRQRQLSATSGPKRQETVTLTLGAHCRYCSQRATSRGMP